MSLEIAWKQNILVTDSNLLKSLLVVFGFGSQAFICEFSRQNICSVGVGTYINLCERFWKRKQKCVLLPKFPFHKENITFMEGNTV